MTDFATWFTSLIILKYYQHVQSVKRSKLPKSGDAFVSIDRLNLTNHLTWRQKLLTSYVCQKYRNCFEIIINFLPNICTNFCDFSYGRLLFTEISSFTNIVYLWRHWRLPTMSYKRHVPKYLLILNKKGLSYYL